MIESLPPYIPSRVMGYIPINIKFIFTAPTNINDKTVMEASVSDSDVKTTIDDKSIYHRKKQSERIREVDRANLPMNGLQLLGVNWIRNRKSYLFLTPDNFLVVMYEAEFLEAIYKLGISANGYLSGEYIFAKFTNDSSNIRLIRVGSEIHKLLIDATKLRNSKIIPVKKLIIGHKYESISGSVGVFLGRMSTAYPLVNIKTKVDMDFRHIISNNDLLLFKEDSIELVKICLMNRVMLWYENYNYEKDNILESLKSDGSMLNNLSFCISHSYRKDLGKFTDVTWKDIKEKSLLTKFESTGYPYSLDKRRNFKNRDVKFNQPFNAWYNGEISKLRLMHEIKEPLEIPDIFKNLPIEGF